MMQPASQMQAANATVPVLGKHLQLVHPMYILWCSVAWSDVIIFGTALHMVVLLQQHLTCVLVGRPVCGHVLYMAMHCAQPCTL